MKSAVLVAGLLVLLVAAVGMACGTAPRAPDASTTLCFPYADAGPGSECAGPTLRCKTGQPGCAPLGDVDGELPIVDGEPGYLELATLSFMSATEARAPTPPYLEGRMTERGFVPTSRRVHRVHR